MESSKLINYSKLLKQTCVDYTQMSVFNNNPLIFKKGNGVYLWDVNDKRYIDTFGGVWVCIFGHNYKPINEVIINQLEKLTFYPGLHGISEDTLKFVEDFSSITPKNLNFVKAYTGGSEADEAAIKFARQYHKQTNNSTKYKVLSLNLSYHGGTFATSSASGVGKRKLKYEPLMPGFIKIPSPYQINRRIKNWEEANLLSADIVEDTIINEHPDTISSLIIEPISNTAGIIEPSTSYFEKIRRLCDEHNIFLIFDEVLTGMAKTGKMFMSDYLTIDPDILTAGKALSNGTVPLSAIAVDTKFVDAFIGTAESDTAFAHGHTYAGMPLASAVGSAVIKEIETKNYIQKANNIGTQLRNKLESLRKYDFVIDVRGRGSVLCVEVDNNYFHKRYKNFSSFGEHLKKETLKNGLIVRIDPHWFAFSPPLISTEDEINELFFLLEKSIEGVLKSCK